MTGTQPNNTSGIKPRGYNILVEPKEIEKVTRFGLHLPDEVIEKNEFARQEGVIIAVSPMAFMFDDWPKGEPVPKIGDRVMFSKYAADQVKGRDGKTYWILADKSVMALIED